MEMPSLDRPTIQKRLQKLLGFWTTPSKQLALGDFLLSLPCTCEFDQERCDRHWLLNQFRYEIEKRMRVPQAILKFLQADYTNLTVLSKRKNTCILPPTGKYIILSDIHQGAFAWSYDERDYFWKNREIYLTLLNNYFNKGFTLIELGDIEEFWLKRILISFDDHWKYQLETFTELYEIRRKFYEQNRYVKIRGNHDNLWLEKDFVKRYLWGGAHLEGLQIYEFAVIGDQFLLMHGHQIDRRNRDIDSGKGYIWTQVGAVIEFFTDTTLFGMKKPKNGWITHPQSQLIRTRKIDKDIYGKEKLNAIFGSLAQLLNIYLIHGHNHAPKCLPDGDFTFNSGCGVFEGIINGIELNFDTDVIRLVDWNDDHGLPSAPTILCEEVISDLRKKL